MLSLFDKYLRNSSTENELKEQISKLGKLCQKSWKWTPCENLLHNHDIAFINPIKKYHIYHELDVAFFNLQIKLLKAQLQRKTWSQIEEILRHKQRLRLNNIHRHSRQSLMCGLSKRNLWFLINDLNKRGFDLLITTNQATYKILKNKPNSKMPPRKKPMDQYDYVDPTTYGEFFVRVDMKKFERYKVLYLRESFPACILQIIASFV